MSLYTASSRQSNSILIRQKPKLRLLGKMVRSEGDQEKIYQIRTYQKPKKPKQNPTITQSKPRKTKI
jgi:hypothetical protein